ncbi:MAG: hypothetical protein RQ751_07290 [Longimicrobiales bacterium]|nr:hypothetical protein [Longimicrobiales bacterium]
MKHGTDLAERTTATAKLLQWRPGGALRLATRLAAWGLGVGAGSFLLSAILGPSSLLHTAGGAGLILGGLAAASWSAIVIRRPGIRPLWRFGAALGVPFGCAASVVGAWHFLVTLETAFASPALVRLSMVVMILLGAVLAVILGGDILRYLLGTPEREPETGGG